MKFKIKFLAKYFIFFLIASINSLVFGNTGVDINFGDSIGVNQNIRNLKNRKQIYENEILEKVNKGGAIEPKMGKAFFGLNSFFNEDYCNEIGDSNED